MEPTTHNGADLDGGEAVLDVIGLRVAYGPFVAVNSISFRCEKGAVTSIIGPNGSGKTSTLNALTGHVASTGVIRLAGVDVSGQPPGKMFRQGVVRTFQNLDLIDDRTVRDNVSLGVRSPVRATFVESLIGAPRMWKERRQCGYAAEKALEILGLSDVAGLKAGALPYGQRRRAEVARAIAGSPTLILLDEPTAGMGPAESREFAEVLRYLARTLELALLVIEHDMAVVRAVVDHVYVLDHGNVIVDGDPTSVLQSEAVRRVYLGVQEEIDAHS
jgi:branched-chain amino acid transport system ATP-binding protein